MKWQLKFGAVIVVIALIGYATYSIYSVYVENVLLKQQNQRQQFITNNAYHSIRLFNEISRINSENRQQSAVDSETTQAAIKTVVVSHDCAHRIVPDGAVVRLQQHTNRIRATAPDTDSATSAR
ncbi:hypothetical protein [Xenorhabdus thuongxuanensis]|uniref:Uncharacterized protein n=1 Tax=Xenorhabdus thuongxuanensis TaxID=1873484 RepID=A0A1Q5TNR7_9GAMM|nr:hypothetical protein [Xenorhabdus thuongxuanensis]OKP01873.1 hypothetical protein Xentx_03316 [Xenorhabdus thuongxuanensis]